MQESYRNLLHYLPDIVYQLDEHGNFVYINESVSKLGYTPSDLLGNHFSTLIKSLKEGEIIDREILCRQHAKGEKKVVNERRTGKRITRHLDVRLVYRDGNAHTEAILFAIGGSVHSGKKAGFSGTIGIIRDKELDRSGKTLVQVERYYRLISENSSEMIFIIAHDSTILSVSDSARKILKIIPFDLIGESFEEMVHPDDQFITRRIFDGKTDHSRKIEFRIAGSDSAWFTCESTVMPVLDEKKQSPVCYVFNLLDITERKEFEIAQARRERIYRTLLRVSPDAIVFFDKEGDVIMSNDRAAEIMGLPRQDIIGIHYLDMITEDQRERAREIRNELVRDGYVADRSLDFRRSDGTMIPVEFSVSIVNDQNQMVEGYLMVLRDISVRRKIEAEKKRLEDTLLQIIVNRLSDREVELLQLLSSGLSWPDDKKEICEKMKANSGTLDQFVFRIRKKMEITDMQTIVRIVSLRFGWDNVHERK